MTSIDQTQPILVTGATGYVAGWVIQRLLEHGRTVHAAVRDPSNRKKIQHLHDMADAAPGKVELFKADLLNPGSYSEAMKDCELVFHTASPFALGVKDPIKQLIEPAKLGTRNVLASVDATPSVKRVVLTSSCAAIFGDNVDLQSAPTGEFTEEVWNTTSSADHQPYSYSKTLAEQEAWDIAGKQERWDLVVVNPSLVMGPGTNPRGTSESFTIIKQLGDGTFKMGAPRIGMGVVDVRDLAEAHLLAAFNPSAQGRHIISGHNTDISEFGPLLRAKFGDRYPFPKGTMPKWLVWLGGPLKNKALTRKMVHRNAGLPWKANNKKSLTQLGVSYRPLSETLTDFFQQMVDEGIVDSHK